MHDYDMHLLESATSLLALTYLSFRHSACFTDGASLLSCALCFFTTHENFENTALHHFNMAMHFNHMVMVIRAVVCDWPTTTNNLFPICHSAGLHQSRKFPLGQDQDPPDKEPP